MAHRTCKYRIRQLYNTSKRTADYTVHESLQRIIEAPNTATATATVKPPAILGLLAFPFLPPCEPELPIYTYKRKSRDMSVRVKQPNNEKYRQPVKCHKHCCSFGGRIRLRMYWMARSRRYKSRMLLRSFEWCGHRNN